MNADSIHNLPTDDSFPSEKELQIVKELFMKNKKDFKKIALSMKDTGVVFVLFLIFSLPFSDTMIKKYVKNETFAVVLKVFIFTLLFFFLTNLNLIKK